MLVIGGGLAGCATTYFLAKNGIDVVLIERHDLNAFASGSNAGSLHAQIPHAEFLELGEEWAQGFAPVIPLMLESISLWARLEEELDTDLEFSLAGGLLVARTEAQLRAIERKAAIERAHGLAIEILGREDLRRLAPYLADDLVGAGFCPTEGKANPLAATPAFARAAAKLGATVLRRAPVEAIRREGDGFAVSTGGGMIRAHRIVNCAGAEAGRIAAMVGLDLSIEGHPIQVNVTEPAAPLVPHLVYFAGGKLTLKQTRRGAFLIGGGWPAIFAPGDARPRVDPRSIEANLRIAVSVVPALADVHLLRIWPAIVNGTADWRPILGEVPGVPGFYMCCFPWMGFTAGPICGLAVAELILGRKPSVDITQFSALGNAT